MKKYEVLKELGLFKVVIFSCFFDIFLVEFFVLLLILSATVMKKSMYFVSDEFSGHPVGVSLK